LKGLAQCGWAVLFAYGRVIVETLHPVEIKHAYEVFSFRRMQSFHVNYWLQVSGEHH